MGAVRNRDIDMRMNSRLGLLLLASVVTSAPAAAVVRVATYTGTLASGYDLAGIFGAANSDLTNLPYVATITYDTLKGLRYINGAGYPGSDEVQGGTFNGLSSPITDFKVTIKSMNYSFVFSYFSDVTTASTLQQNYSSASASGQDGFSDFVYVQAFGSGLFPISLETNFLSTADLRGDFNIISADHQVILAQGRLNSPGVYSVSDPLPPAVNTVPEPTSWAMFIAGFGLIGSMLRTRRGVLVYA